MYNDSLSGLDIFKDTGKSNPVPSLGKENQKQEPVKKMGKVQVPHVIKQKEVEDVPAKQPVMPKAVPNVVPQREVIEVQADVEQTKEDKQL